MDFTFGSSLYLFMNRSSVFPQVSYVRRSVSECNGRLHTYVAYIHINLKKNSVLHKQVVPRILAICYFQQFPNFILVSAHIIIRNAGKCYIRKITVIQIVHSTECNLGHFSQRLTLLPIMKATVCFWRHSPQWARVSSFTRLLDHTQRRTTEGRTPLEE